MDHGIYSHAAVWDGKSVVEATTHGIVKCELKDETDGQWYVDVYRWQTPPPPPIHVMGEKAYPPGPVTLRADELANTKAQYAYDELLMGALLIWLSEKPNDIRLRIWIRAHGDEIERWIEERILSKDRKGITCTEVVCRSYWEAASEPPNKYEIRVPIDGSRVERALRILTLAPDEHLTGYDGQRERFGRLFAQAVGGVTGDQIVALTNIHDLAGETDVMGVVGKDVPLFFVSPRELQKSPNLVCHGRLSENLNPPPPGCLFVDIAQLVCDALSKRKPSRAR
jgi:hypothetical protein